VSEPTFSDNDFCFACGSKNPLGLQLQFFVDGNRLCTRFRPQPHLQGFEGVLHGGLQSAVLDDLMCNHLFRIEKISTTTAELSLRFRLPVPIEGELLFASEVTGRHGKVWEMKATVIPYGGDPRPLTTATGRFVEIESAGEQ
jgi:acyl-coenzyme A thioesterase PaaI-like protein